MRQPTASIYADMALSQTIIAAASSIAKLRMTIIIYGGTGKIAAAVIGEESCEGADIIAT